MPVTMRLLSSCAACALTTMFFTHVALAEESSFFSRLVPAGTEQKPDRAPLSSMNDKIRSGKASAEDYLEFAANLRRTGNAEEAANVLHKAQSKYPDNTTILKQLGIAMVDAKHPIEAIEVFDVLAAIEPDNALAYNGKAVAFDTAGNHTAALELYEKALSLAPFSVAINNNMAMSMILNDQLDSAQTILETLYKQNPDVPKIRYNLALVYGLKGDKKRAMELNLESLSQKQAEENLKFYQHYSSKKGDHKPVELMKSDGRPIDDLFTEAPAAEPEKAPAEKIAVVPAAEPVIEASPSAGENIAIVPSEPVIQEASPSAGMPAGDKNYSEIPGQSQPSITTLFGDDAVYEFPTGRRN